MINDIIGNKRTDLSYPIRSGRKIAVVSMLSDNVQYWLQGSIKVLLNTSKKIVLNKGVYTDKELNAILGPELKLRMVSHDDVLRNNKLEKVMKISISLDELDNSDNLEDGRPSNVLLAYHVTDDDDKHFTHFEPHTPQYKKLKNGEFTSLNLRIMDQSGKVITDGPGTTVVLHIQ